jgi:single-strand DNA-binding protein
MNQVVVVGRLGKDPEIKYTPSGSAVANFSIATDSEWTDKSGNKQKNTHWHDIVVWGKTAESCSQLAKGQLVVIVGRLQTRAWEGRDGSKRKSTEVVASNIGISIVGNRGESEFERPPAAPVTDVGITDDDIPF